MKLIDGDELLEEMVFEMCGTGYQSLACSVVSMAREIEDVIPVVRCKDCIFRSGKVEGQPNVICINMKDDDFCSYGERVK